MSFQFSCPQGHVLQSELSQVGQLFQCPYCGESFVIPSPHGEHGDPYSDPNAGGFMQGAPAWPSGQGQQPGFSAQPFPLQGFPGHGGSSPVTPIAGGAFTLPAQPLGAFQPLPPGQAGSFPLPVPAQPVEDTPAQGGGSRFVFDFDPTAKAALPFDMPGGGGDSGGTESHAFEHDAGAMQPFRTPESPETRPLTDFAELGEGPKKIKTLHVRCPSGHALKVSSEQNRKPVRCSVCKQVFEVRYENSLEFQRRTEKVVTRARNKEGQVWLAWALVAAFIGIVGIVLLIIYTTSHG